MITFKKVMSFLGFASLFSSITMGAQYEHVEIKISRDILDENSDLIDLASRANSISNQSNNNIVLSFKNVNTVDFESMTRLLETKYGDKIDIKSVDYVSAVLGTQDDMK